MLRLLILRCVPVLAMTVGFVSQAPAQVPDKIPLYEGTISAAGVFTLDMELIWNHRTGRIHSKGEIRVLGARMLVSEADGRIENGNTLVIDKEWRGGSGLRVETTLRFRPEGGRKIAWTLQYKAYNKNATGIFGGNDPLAKSGTRSGTIQARQAPWEGLNGGGGGPAQGERKQAVFVQNKTSHKLWVAAHYRLNGQWMTQGFYVLEPGQKSGPICHTDNRWIYFYANGPDRRPVWSGSETSQMIFGERYGFFKADTGTGFGDYTHNFLP